MAHSKVCKEMEKFGKGIGNTCRYNIVEALSKGPKTVSEIMAAVGQSQSAVSQHLKVLKYANIVTDERNGREVYYTLNAAYALKLLKDLVDDFEKGKSKK